MARHKELRTVLSVVIGLSALVAAEPARPQEGLRPPATSAAGATEAPATSRLPEFEKQIAELATRGQEWAAKAAEYEQARVGAPERLRLLEAEIAAFQSHEQREIPATATLEELTAQRLDAEQDLALARKEAADLDAEADLRSERRKRIPELLAAAKERLQQLARQEAPAAEADAAIAEARQRLDAVRREALEREIEAYQNELSSYDARGVLLGRRIDRARLRMASAEVRVERLGVAVTSLEQRGARRQAAEARQSLEWAEALPPSLQDVGRKLAETNMQLAERRAGPEGLLAQIDDVREKLTRAEGSVAEIEASSANLESKIKAAGLTDSVGLLLRKQRADAADAGKYARFIRMRQELISSVQLEQIALRDERGELADIDALAVRDLDRLAPQLSTAERNQAESLLRQLYETRRRYTDALIEDYETYFQKLVDFSATQQQLIQKTQKLRDFIDERILWIPSSQAVKPGLLGDGRDALAWFFEPRFWGQLLRALRGVAGSAILLNASVALLLVLSVPLTRRARARIRELGEAARSAACTRFAPTWEAFLLTLLLLPWLPGSLGYLGWQLGISPDATQFTRCVAGGMLAAALLWITLRLPRELLRAGGVGTCHFGWPADSAKSLRRQLSWLTAVAVPGVFLIFVFELRGEDAWKESVGRLTFAVLMVATAAFAHRTLRPGGALTRILRAFALAGRRPGVWRTLHYAALAFSVFLAAATLRGYYWTALSLATRFHFTLFFLLGLFVVFQLLTRWSLLNGRRVALEQARERREALAARRQQQAAGEPEAEVPEVPEPELDLATVRVQTSRLMSSTRLFLMVIGLWLIWADVIPAVGILREVRLWNVTETVTLSVTDASGAERFTTEDRVVPVTLANLLLAVLILVLTLGMVRNLPGLLEVSLFRRLGVGAGERYAYATIVNYAITIAGVVLAFHAIGVGWSNIQWLIAAVGLGLGFGLQEIFANFVSGLIILFERPIRVGDTVTVGDISGTVTKIHIRATWITGFDRKELVVPNKEFVTGRLINWSLSDPILRIDIPVGIAYGSDTDKAIEVLRDVASKTEHVLGDPPPQVLFLGFGDSSLNFEVRVFSPDVAHLFPIRHQIHMGIDAAFRRAGIEIAFPQRDVHLRSVPTAWQATSRSEAER